ncbi:uncharacterized protein LOC121880315 [Homarus americanus]|uniref:Uncharacterized protein n=1 Tax=Homarus americanus TaxID=6706 RepID=A0A8J5MMS8_HOMAM|nr:uncharacterized protein LOC121880315 [Homarus americanus]KAG7157221.1 hypothetical protein Hamer_G010076 [Homarus americanus]
MALLYGARCQEHSLDLPRHHNVDEELKLPDFDFDQPSAPLQPDFALSNNTSLNVTYSELERGTNETSNATNPNPTLSLPAVIDTKKKADIELSSSADSEATVDVTSKSVVQVFTDEDEDKEACIDWCLSDAGEFVCCTSNLQ